MKPVNQIIPVFICLLFSCNSQNKTAPSLNEEVDKQSMTAINLLGSFVGDFGDNKITLLITKATADSVAGRSVVGGNDRPFNGTIKASTGGYNISAKEPGDDKNDGLFNFTINPAKPDEVTGTWQPFNASGKLISKAFNLQRRSFLYLADVGDYPQASKRLLTEDDVNNLTKEELEMMRNEIFARHGYCFKMKHLRESFEDKDWYIPNSTDVKKDLTDIEKKNVALIKKFEKYAVEFGDDFGR